MSFTSKFLGCGLPAVVAFALGGCTTEAASGTDSQDVRSGAADGQSLTAAYNTSDVNNVWRLEGTVGYFEGDATLVLQNATQANNPLIKHNIHSGNGMSVGPFFADVTLEGSVSKTEPAVGDCVAVKTDGGPRGLSDEEIRRSKEFGAFVYVSDPQSGAPERPAWGVKGDRPKVYKTVAECLIDPDRSWASAHPDDKLEHAANVSGQVGLKGKITQFELAANVALVNVSNVTEPLLLEKGFKSSGELDVTVSLPATVKAGDCIAVKNVGGGRGFSDDEARAMEEFGAFLYSKTEDSKVFRTSAECLKDAAANR